MERTAYLEIQLELVFLLGVSEFLFLHFCELAVCSTKLAALCSPRPRGVLGFLVSQKSNDSAWCGFASERIRQYTYTGASDIINAKSHSIVALI